MADEHNDLSLPGDLFRSGPFAQQIWPDQKSISSRQLAVFIRNGTDPAGHVKLSP
jgi:hypothetical protein